MTKILVIGSTVRHIDGSGIGMIQRFIGTPSIGDGVHARILWDTGGSSVVRLDLLVKV